MPRGDWCKSKGFSCAIISRAGPPNLRSCSWRPAVSCICPSWRAVGGLHLSFPGTWGWRSSGCIGSPERAEAVSPNSRPWCQMIRWEIPGLAKKSKFLVLWAAGRSRRPRDRKALHSRRASLKKKKKTHKEKAKKTLHLYHFKKSAVCEPGPCVAGARRGA